MSDKSLRDIFSEAYVKSRITKLSSDSQATEDAIEMVAQHAIATSPLVKQLVRALEAMDADPESEYSLKKTYDALSSYRAAIGKGNDE